MHVVLITDSSPSIGISMCSSLHRILHSLFFCDEIAKQQTVTYITMSDLNTIVPITRLLLNADDSNAFSEPDRSSNSSCPHNNSSCELSAAAMLQYTIYMYRRVSETFTAQCIGFTLTVCIVTCLWCWYFTCRTLFCDFGLFPCDFGCLRSN